MKYLAMLQHDTIQSDSSLPISENALQKLLGIKETPYLDLQSMAASLRVTFLSGEKITKRVNTFATRLREALSDSGASLVPSDLTSSSLRHGASSKRLVAIATGDWSTGNLPVDQIADLRTTTLVGVLDGPCPFCNKSDYQERLNGIVQALAWNVVQIVVFVEDERWTICTMNGAIIVADMGVQFRVHVRTLFIPKIAAAIVPPRLEDFDVREGQLDLTSEDITKYTQDFIQSGPLWANSNLMLFHTPVSSLKFRSRRYKRIVSAFLDHRTGMSYGFLARQIAVSIRPAMSISESSNTLGQLSWDDCGIARSSGRHYVLVETNGEKLVVEVPDVWALTTRSGCNKSKVDIQKDLLMLGLVNGKVVVLTSKGLDGQADIKPSYDTLTILSHCLGNAFAASIIMRTHERARFPMMLSNNGVALSHWHGYVTPGTWPREYLLHGKDNPPVSCSTHQSAIFAITGKLEAVSQSIRLGLDFLGDIHIEPYHGTNVTGSSLLELAEMVLEYREKGSPSAWISHQARTSL